MNNRKKGSIFAGILSIVIITVTIFSYAIPAQAAVKKKLTLTQAQSLAAAENKNYQTIYNKITMKTIRYESAVEAAGLKQSDKSTYRFSPLLEFQLPTQPTLAEEYEWQYKPIQLQSELNFLKHQLAVCEYKVKEQVSIAYIQAYVCQEKQALLEAELTKQQQELKRNQAQAACGSSNYKEVQKSQQIIETINNDLAQQMRLWQAELSKISEQTGLDVTKGYELEYPLSDIELSRDNLEKVIEHILEQEESCYEAKLAESAAYLSLTTVESLMQSKYGAKMDALQIHINQAKTGQEVNETAFKADFDAFLKEIDKSWEGEEEVLFVKVNKEWFQGETEGSRYLEDDPYALYNAALEYRDALSGKEALQAELTQKVKDDYEALVTAKNAYEEAEKTKEALEEEVVRNQELCRLGKLTYEEAYLKQQEYFEYSLQLMDSLSAYGQCLQEYDCQTYGGLKLFMGKKNNSAVDMDSIVASQQMEGAYYTIDYRVEDRMFLFSVQIPENFSVGITAYELYVNGVKIGEKTEISQQLKHLSLDFAAVEKAEVYLYEGEELYSICEINPYTSKAALEIQGDYQLKSNEGSQKNAKKLAVFSCHTDKEKKLTTLTLSPVSGEDIAYYALAASKDSFLYSQEPISIENDYQYISLLANELEDIIIYFYNKDKELLYQGEFDVLERCIYQKTENQ